MLAVMVFESCEVSFEAVGGRRNSGIFEVMKHMRQSFEQHTSGAYEIADDPATSGNFRQLETIAVFPGLNGGEKSPFLDHVADRGHLEKNLPQMAGIWATWILTTPHQTLALNMYQAALDNDRRPYCFEDSDGLGVAIDRAADWGQPVGLEQFEERRELRLRVFVDPILAVDNPARSSIHSSNEATASMQESAVEDQMASNKHLGRRWGPAEPVTDDTLQRRRAEAAEMLELAYAESFGQPLLEPYPLVLEVFVESLPVKRPAAVETPPSLAAIAVMTVPFDSVAATSRAMFFSGSYRDHGTTSIMESTSH
jgi:hypothetical protein